MFCVCFRYQIALSVTNVTQGINFAVNFILYCAVSKPFRDNLRGQILCRQNSGGNTSMVRAESMRYNLVEVQADPTRTTRLVPRP